MGKEYERRESGDKIVIEDSDDEKEEGELEEGEIDLDFGLIRDVEMENEFFVVLISVVDEVEDDRVWKERELESKVKMICDVLESMFLV